MLPHCFIHNNELVLESWLFKVFSRVWILAKLCYLGFEATFPWQSKRNFIVWSYYDDVANMLCQISCIDVWKIDVVCLFLRNARTHQLENLYCDWGWFYSPYWFLCIGFHIIRTTYIFSLGVPDQKLYDGQALMIFTYYFPGTGWAWFRGSQTKYCRYDSFREFLFKHLRVSLSLSPINLTTPYGFIFMFSNYMDQTNLC